MIQARGQMPPGEMNRTEAAYAAELEMQQRVGEIEAYMFESVKLRLAANTFYTPDFMVMRKDGEIEFHEVKGFWRDDARVKTKVAAQQYPMFRFIAVTKERAGWKTETF